MSNIKQIIMQVAEDAKKEVLDEYAKKAVDGIVKNGTKKWEDEQTSLDEFKQELLEMSEDELRLFVPDVYQKDIYHISYEMLKEKGIKLLSYDIDDTIDDVLMNNIQARTPLKFSMPKEAKKLVDKLHSMGFIVVLITNAIPEIALGAHSQLGTDDYIARAEKPETISFENMLEKYNLHKSQMAHIGNSMRDDVCGGNRAGITTCLVRRNGWAMGLAKKMKTLAGSTTRGKLIREKLAQKGIWHKHHIKEKGDQYYQLGEVQQYSPDFSVKNVSRKYSDAMIEHR